MTVSYRSSSGARLTVFQFIEGFYNASRRYSAAGYLLPIEYERTSRKHRPAERPSTETANFNIQLKWSSIYHVRVKMAEIGKENA